jgi:amino acid transporter
MNIDTRETKLIKRQSKAPKKFGTFKGVFLPSILTILGVIMYLRIGWVIGNVGLVLTILIVTMATSITLVTGLSISAIATNMKVKGGGAYFMISRSIGVEAGAAVGISLFLAQAVGVSFYIAGFAESLFSIWGTTPLLHNLYADISIQTIAIISLIFVAILAFISANLALKMQMVIFVMILGSLISFFLGAAPEGGFTPVTRELPRLAPFWIVFAVFFPAVTGILSGVSMSGDLKEPSKSIPTGTLAAIGVGYVVYIVIPIVLYYLVPRDILRTDQMIFQKVAKIEGLVLLGIWGATLSSALGSLLAAPRTLQALARDKIVPQWLGRGFGNEDTPRTATLVTFIIAFVTILAGNLDSIAPVLTMFFLATYGALNFIAGLEELIKNPSWRPDFKVHFSVSFIGALLCLGVMLMINSGATFIAIFVLTLLYYFTVKRNINAPWSDLRSSILQTLARFSIYNLESFIPNARTWRPHIFVLSGAPTQRWHLIKLANSFTQGKSFLFVASIIQSEDNDQSKLDSIKESVEQFLDKRHIKALVEVNSATDFYTGAKEFVKSYGVGPLTPNTFVIGETKKREKFVQFAEFLRLVYQSKRNLVIIRDSEDEKNIEQSLATSKSRTALIKENCGKKICCWWGGKQSNVGLMLTLGYMLQNSPEWIGSKLLVKTLANSVDDAVHVEKYLNKFLLDARIVAETEVIIDSSANENRISTTLKEYSKDSDLVFLGMKRPGQDETSEEYAKYYENILASTVDFPPLVLVLHAEEIVFKEIFMEEDK